MNPLRKTVLYAIAAAAIASPTLLAQNSSPAPPTTQGLERLKALEGEWIDVDGVFGVKGAVAVTYRVTSGGKTVVETFPIDTPGEMVTVYHLDGDDLVLTHYCSGGTQPRMRSKGLQGNVLAFDFDGGTNIDPAKTSHMHAAKYEFVSADEVRATWINWANGKADDHVASFRIRRKSSSLEFGDLEIWRLGDLVHLVIW
jgi:hypothetical protein